MKVTKRTVYSVDNFETTFEPIEDTITIDKTKEGYTIKYLIQDDCNETPREWDNLGKMVCWHRNYNLGDKHNYAEPSDFFIGMAEDLGISEKQLETFSSDAMQKFVLKHKDIILLPLYLYDHSGISMRTYPHGQHVAWDCGQVGYIYVTKEMVIKEYGKFTKKNIEQAIEVMKGEIDTYDKCIQGEVYCCVMDKYDHKKNKLDYDVVGGYYGADYALKTLKEGDF